MGLVGHLSRQLCTHGPGGRPKPCCGRALCRRSQTTGAAYKMDAHKHTLVTQFDPEEPVEEVEEQDDGACGYLQISTISPPQFVQFRHNPTDLRVLLNKERLAGKAPPPKLTAHQQQVVQRLVDAHGDDVEVRISAVLDAFLLLDSTLSMYQPQLCINHRATQAMAKDRKLNRMLLPVSKLRKLLLSFHHGTTHRFRVPHKHNKFKSH